MCLWEIINIRYGPVQSNPKDDNIIARSFIRDTFSAIVSFLGSMNVSTKIVSWKFPVYT
jgi:hypothetical protein